MTTEDAIRLLKWVICSGNESEDLEYHGVSVKNALDMAIKALKQTSVLDQIKWERDIAISQLKDLGYGLGEKPRTDGDLISRQAVNKLRKYNLAGGVHTVSIDDINKLPSAEKTAEWISVRKQKPEDYEEVIATVRYDYKDKQEYEVVTGVRYSKEDGWEWAYEAGADYWESINGVVAWQPLPKPYEVKR